VKKKFSILDWRLPAENRAGEPRFSLTENRKSKIENGFTLIEVMVAMALLSLIVIALMAVFNNTQAAFRASVTQTDVLEGGRAAMDLISTDLRAMSPSGLATNGEVNENFWVGSYGYPPLIQTLVASVSGGERTNILESFFILSRGNLGGVPTWTGTGYAVITNPPSGSPLYPLYRFTTNYPVASAGAVSSLFTNFSNFLNAPTNYSHLIDGVVGLRLHAFDVNGVLINSTGQSYGTNSVYVSGETGYYFLSNALPAAVEIEMATLEDRTLQRAESRPPGPLRDQYLQGQAGNLHVFRQRVTIPNVDPSAYP
jgi:prepilin-type N-terminal cleavage/methylation domain-containing protein